MPQDPIIFIEAPILHTHTHTHAASYSSRAGTTLHPGPQRQVESQAGLKLSGKHAQLHIDESICIYFYRFCIDTHHTCEYLCLNVKPEHRKWLYDPGSVVPTPPFPTPMVPPPPVVWCGGVVWVGWFPPACLDLLGVFGKPMLMMILMMMMTIIMITIITIILAFLWLVGHDLCKSCLFGALAIGLQWVSCHRDRACQGTRST